MREADFAQAHLNFFLPSFSRTIADIRIQSIVQGGPADLAGLLVGDFIVNVDGHSLLEETNAGANRILSATGDEAVIAVRREFSAGTENALADLPPNLAEDRTQGEPKEFSLTS